jgi:uracil-DNA glycosylase
MTQTVDLENIKVKLIEKLKPSGWAVKLKSFVYSSDFDKILHTLYDEREAGKRFTPPLKQVFRAFEECPLNDLKVVIIGQDPYPYLGVADGIAFSCGNTGKPQPSLVNIFEAIDNTIHEGMHDTIHDPDLTRWANQGVLLLNKALTCQVDKVGSHYGIWNDFVMYVLDMLNLTNSGLIFCLLGSKAQELESMISSQNHYIIKASHPASAGYNKTQWDCNDLFNEANKIIEGNNGPEFKITW